METKPQNSSLDLYKVCLRTFTWRGTAPSKSSTPFPSIFPSKQTGPGPRADPAPLRLTSSTGLCPARPAPAPLFSLFPFVGIAAEVATGSAGSLAPGLPQVRTGLTKFGGTGRIWDLEKNWTQATRLWGKLWSEQP